MKKYPLEEKTGVMSNWSKMPKISKPGLFYNGPCYVKQRKKTRNVINLNFTSTCWPYTTLNLTGNIVVYLLKTI
jgi:hypothetical protein